MLLKRKKPKSKTPIIFKLSKAEQEQIRLPPHESLAAFRAASHTATDWFNITFRIKVGYELAKACYTAEAVEGMLDTLHACLSIRARYLATLRWSATESELELLQLGIATTDLMQDDTTRRDQLKAHHTARTYVHELLNT